MIRNLLALFFIGVVFIMSGCFNPYAPELTDMLETSDLIVTSQKSPEEVLQNFKVAYTFRDSLLYSDVIDTSFLFVYFNPNEGSSGRFVSWGREEDLTTTGRHLRHFQVIDLVWNATLYEIQAEDTGELSKGFNLTLVGDDIDYQVSGRAVFSFRKCQDEKWRITRWKDESDL